MFKKKTETIFSITFYVNFKKKKNHSTVNFFYYIYIYERYLQQ